MPIFPFFSPPMIGLDIQPEGIRLVQLRKNRQGFLLERALKIDFFHEVFVDGKIKYWHILAEALAKLLVDIDLKEVPVAAHIPINLTKMQHLSLPSDMHSIEIEGEIYSHLQRDLPEMMEGLCIDFTVLEEKKDGQLDIFFSAVRQEYLSQYVDCMRSIGLKVQVIDVDMYALARGIDRLLALKRASKITVAALLLTQKITTFIVFNQQKVLFHHQWETLLGTDFLPEFKQALQFFLATFPQFSIHDFALCGLSKEQSVEMIAHLQDIKCQIHLPNLLKKVKKKSKTDATTFLSQPWDFMMAIGLAMREVPLW